MTPSTNIINEYITESVQMSLDKQADTKHECLYLKELLGNGPQSFLYRGSVLCMKMFPWTS